jgi:transcriptional regulator with XRE-family HTH domain
MDDRSLRFTSQRMARSPVKPAVNHLRAWREFRRMTQEQLADSIGTAGNVIGLLESGERGLSHKWLLKLAPALGTTPGFLLDHDPYDMDTSFLDAVMAVPAEDRAQVLAIIETFKKRA